MDSQLSPPFQNVKIIHFKIPGKKKVSPILFPHAPIRQGIKVFKQNHSS